MTTRRPHKSDIIYVAGHTGLVGSTVLRALKRAGYTQLLTRTHAELDLTQATGVHEFFAAHRPAYVVLAAARVGGIQENSRRPADFIRDNLLIQTNVIDAAYRNGCAKLLLLGSSCIYPVDAPQPIREQALLTGPLEPSSEAYAVAKIAGIRMLQAYAQQHGFCGISLMPASVYGPGDNFELGSCHVLPALMRRFHTAKVEKAPVVVVWGSGKPRREFLHARDLASACLFLLRNYSDPEVVNVGAGQDISIAELAARIRTVVGYEGDIAFDPTRPDGVARKLLDCSKLNRLGWRASLDLEQGLHATYRWYCSSINRR